MVVRTSRLVWTLALGSLIIAALTPAQVTASPGVKQYAAAAVETVTTTPSTAPIADTTTPLVTPTATLTATVPPSLAAPTGSATAAPPSASPATVTVVPPATVTGAPTALATDTVTATDTITTPLTIAPTGIVTAPLTATASVTATATGTVTATATTPPPSPAVPAPQATWPKAPLAFAPNQGQSAAQVAFLAHGPGYTLFLGATDTTLAALRVAPPLTATTDLPTARVQLAPLTATEEDVIRLHYVGANASATVSGQDPRAGLVNYLTGADPHGWHTALPTFGRVSVKDLYPGITHVYDGQNGHLEDDWQVAAGANPAQIAFTADGARGLRVDGQGNLVLDTAFGPLIAHAPLAYQVLAGQRRSVSVQYTLTGANQIGFTLGAYDPSQPLVIDPVLSYSTYLGGSGDEEATSITVDAAGNAYIAGSTISPNFPTTTGVVSGTLAGSYDAYVTKIAAGGGALVYSTYLGGSGTDSADSIAVDAGGNAYVAGSTASTDFPTTPGAYARTYGGGANDAFVARLNTDGSALTYSTYLGGSGSDEATGLALDATGNAAVTGYTASTNFPTTTGAYATANAGGTDAFVTTLNATGSALVSSTYLGGSGTDVAHAIALDATGAVYVAGQTNSTTFPTTPGAYATANAGRYDAFVAKFSADASTLIYATYLGGPLNEYGYGLAVDADGHAIVTGETQSTTYPTVQALQPANGSQAARTCFSNVTPCTDAFVTELNTSGTGLQYSSYLGGNYDDVGEAIALDSSGAVYVTGNTASTNFPTQNTVQSTLNDGTTCTQSPCNDAFVASFTAPQTCPPGWQCDDVGSPPQPGDQALTGGTWTVYGTGTDITGTVDQFHYVSQNVTGDSNIMARLISQQNTGGCAKAGLMYRASTDPSDVDYSVVVTPACGGASPGIQVTSRAVFSGTTTTAASVPSTLPVYLKITRSGDTFTASTSPDGVTWNPIANSSVSLPNMPSTALFGLATTSQSSAATSAATFDHVSLSGTVDLAQLDTETGHFTQTVGLTTTNLQLSSGQTGAVGADGWQPISVTLGISPATGMLIPATVPFGLQIAPTTRQSTLASLTAEDGITLGIGLAAPGATAQPPAGLEPHALVAQRAQSYAAAPAAMTPVTGQVNLNTITYPSLTFPVVTTPTPTSTITATPTPRGTPVNSAGGLNVYLGYADSLRANPNLPVPWQGSPHTAFVGHADSSGAYDSGAIRLDNTTASTVTVKDVNVVLHTVNSDGTGGPASGQSFDLWGANSIAPGDSLILAATGPGDNFDTSDFPLAGTSCTTPAGPTDNPPHLTLTFADNSQVTMTDTAHVLGTGGYDTVNCPGGNESLQWRALGSTGIAQASGALTLTAPTVTQIAGVPYSQVATLTDASGQPQPNVAVNFSITSGPNSGLTGTAYTDSQGHATFTYTSTVAGTDTIAAAVTNASGGVLTATPVSVTWAPPPLADLALRAIASGLDVRLVLHNASSSGPFTLALTADPNTEFWQDASGAIRATQAVTQYGDDGSPIVVTQTEYLAQAPIATDSSADPAAPVTTGPATTTLLTTADGGPQYLAVNIDSAWLHDPHRVFPVTVDLPIVTALSYENMGLVGSVASCAPSTVAPPTDLVVGTENGCTYNGQLYFGLAGVPYDTPILSATLCLYTPSATGTTGVQLAQNVAPPSGSDPAQPPTWSSAPAIVAGAPTIAQSGSEGHWQSWDVTSLVQQWVSDGATNGGVTLSSSGTPLRFAGPLGAANADPSLAPSLQIGYGPIAPPANPRSGPYYDTAHTIYGEAGSYTIHGEGVANGCPTALHPNITCPSTTQFAPHYLGNLKPSAVAYALGGQFIRFNVQLACPSYSQYGINPNAPGRFWWSTNYDNPLKNSNGQVISWATPNNEGDAGSILSAAVKYDGEIPIITLSPNGGCRRAITPQYWYSQAQDFVSYLYAAIGATSMVYFEIGNEPNGVYWDEYTDGTKFDGVDGQDGTYHYADIFAAAAHGIQSAVAGGSMYRILTAGMFSPTADQNRKLCGKVIGDNIDNVVIAGNAIRLAEQSFSAQQQQSFSVPAGPVVAAQHLGVAVHPYGYDTRGGHYWKNYYSTYNVFDPNDPGYKKRHLNRPNNGCGRLDYMLNTWQNPHNVPGNLPVIFTEDNWSPGPKASWPDEGTYLADLFTWLYDHDSRYHTRTPSLSPLRVLIFRGADAGATPLGIYTVDGSDKPADGTSPNDASTAIPLPACQTTAIRPGISYSIAHNYYYLRYAACYR